MAQEIDTEETHVASNRIQTFVEYRDRLGTYYLRPAEHGRMVLRGWRLGGMSPGDLPAIDAPTLITPRTRDAADAYAGRRVLHIGGGTNWFGATTEFEFLALPSEAAEAS